MVSNEVIWEIECPKCKDALAEWKLGTEVICEDCKNGRE